MSRRIPLCACCGESLSMRLPGQERMLVEYGTPGRPTVGWHFKCLPIDPLASRVPGDVSPDELSAVVGARGPGRFVVGWARNKKNGL